MTEVFAPGTTPKSVFPTSPHALPVGARIGEFEVHRLIGEGGFGIVYLCYDQALDRYVALKEYMPSSLAMRQDTTLAIVVKSKHHEETFEAGLKSFINEARLLAQFDHPSLLKVYRFWQANGTAYMTMPYYEGPTLKQALAALGGPPDEATLRSWLLPMLDALEEIHRVNCYHRDIAPDNILLTASGPLLLDFGAARRVIGDMTQALTVVLKPGFAPIEQYGDAATMSQGAWTDLYALASVVYFAITGRPPMSAVDRVMDDRLEPLSHRVAGRYSHALLATVDTALSVRPQDRPQNVAAFRAMLNARPDEQTADLHLWGEDDAPTEVDAATVPGALGVAPYDEPRTVPTGRQKNEPVSPSEGFASPMAQAARPPSGGAAPPALASPSLPLPERTMVAMPGRAEVVGGLPHAAPALIAPASPTPATSPLNRQPDDQPRTQFVPRSPAATAAVASGAGLAPLSGLAGARDTAAKMGVPAPLPPRPPVTERTAMPSLLPAAGAPQAATPAAVYRLQPAERTEANPPPARNWALWLSLAAFAMATAAAVWTFTRSDADASEPVTPLPAAPHVGVPPAQPTAAVAPLPAPVAPAAPEPLPTPVKAVESGGAEKKASTPSTPAPVQPNAAARPAESVETETVNRPPRGAPPIRLGSPPQSRVEADSPIVLPRSSPPAPAPVPSPPPVAARSDPAPAPAPSGSGLRSIARCADIRQRAGLEDLSAEERQFLRTQCR